MRRPTDLAAIADTIVVLDQAGRVTWFEKSGRVLRTERAVIEPLCGEEHNAGYGGLLQDGSLIVRCAERLSVRVRGEYRQEAGLLRFVVRNNDRRVVGEWEEGRPRADMTPSIRSLLASPIGHLWVESWDSPGEGPRWVIYEADGKAVEGPGQEGR